MRLFIISCLLFASALAQTDMKLSGTYQNWCHGCKHSVALKAFGEEITFSDRNGSAIDGKSFEFETTLPQNATYEVEVEASPGLICQYTNIVGTISEEIRMLLWQKLSTLYQDPVVQKRFLRLLSFILFIIFLYFQLLLFPEFGILDNIKFMCLC